MQVSQNLCKSVDHIDNLNIDFDPDIFFLFVSPLFKDIDGFVQKLKQKFPNSLITGCSTSGEILDTVVEDDSVVLNALKFEKTTIELVSEDVTDARSSYEIGQSLIQKLQKDKLRHVLVFSDGLNINGADLVNGMKDSGLTGVSVTGGLAGDGSDFKKTFTIFNDKVSERLVVAVAMYGDSLTIGFGSHGGWDSFGLERRVTKSDKNVLYEIDGKPALELYKSYLGDKIDELPGSALLFPLSIRLDDTTKPLVRTILGVDEESQSMTFAGNVPEGSMVRFMKANVDRLITGAETSAVGCQEIIKDEPEFAILISCVGRRLVLKQLVEEELEAVREVLGGRPVMTGFYSYGELAPTGVIEDCQLHNQTMTITTFSEPV